MPRFPDPPAPSAAALRTRAQFILDVLDPIKDQCYEGLAVLEPVARTIHAASLSTKHLAEMAHARRGYDLDVLFAPVDDPEAIEALLESTASLGNDNAGSGRNLNRGVLRPSERAKREQANMDGEDGEQLNDGNVTTTRGARQLAEENDLDVADLVRKGKLAPSLFAEYEEVQDPRGADLPLIRQGIGAPSIISKTDIRHYLGRPLNTGRDVSSMEAEAPKTED